MLNLSSAAGHHLRERAFVASDGTGDVAAGRRIQSGIVLEWGAVVSDMVFLSRAGAGGTVSSSATAGCAAGTLARRLASDTRVSRMRGDASVMGTGGHDDQAGAHALLR